jgi:integrase
MASPKFPLTEIAADAFRHQLALSGPGRYLFPSDTNPDGYLKTFKIVWHSTLRKAGVRYFRIYDRRSTYATRLSAGGVADEWVTQVASARRCEGLVAVGTAIADRPPHRSVRAELPHTAPA